MRISSKEVQADFKPIELNIVFETVQELEMFLGAVGGSYLDMEDCATHDFTNPNKWDRGKDITEDLYDWASEKLIEIHNR